MCEVACCRLAHQDIARQGGWGLDALARCYEDNTPPRALLAAAGVNGAAFEDLDASYFAPRFLVTISDSLIVDLYPWLPKLRDDVRQV